MTHPTEISPGNQIDDYLFHELISTSLDSQIWSAHQISVQRDVIICSLAPGFTSEDRELFLHNARLKVQINHPTLGGLLEAISEDNHCFFSMDKLRGDNLGLMLERHETFDPTETTQLIKSIAETYLFIQKQPIATSAVTAYDLFIENRSVVHLNNKFVAGEKSSLINAADKELIGSVFHQMLQPNLPGSTRMASLLTYMINEEAKTPLSWTQIYKLAQEVEQHIIESAQQEPPKKTSIKKKPINLFK